MMKIVIFFFFQTWVPPLKLQTCVQLYIYITDNQVRCHGTIQAASFISLFFPNSLHSLTTTLNRTPFSPRGKGLEVAIDTYPEIHAD